MILLRLSKTQDVVRWEVKVPQGMAAPLRNNHATFWTAAYGEERKRSSERMQTLHRLNPKVIRENPLLPIRQNRLGQVNDMNDYRWSTSEKWLNEWMRAKKSMNEMLWVEMKRRAATRNSRNDMTWTWAETNQTSLKQNEMAEDRT